MMSIDLNNLVNKILLIYLTNSGPTMQAGIAIQSPHIETYFGRSFLVGTVPFQEQDWATGLPVAVACDQIAQFLLFGSEEEYQQKIAQAPSAWESDSETKRGIN